MRRSAGIFVLALMVGGGCHSSPEKMRESSFAEQAAAVRAGRSETIRLEITVVSDADLTALEGLSGLRELTLEQGDVSATGTSRIVDLENLERLKIGAGRIDDAALVHIARLQSLKTLNLPAAQFSDQGLAELVSLEKLELLRFSSSNVSDTGLAHIAKLPALRFLHLLDVPITDAGLVHIKEMKKLESFYLDGGNATDDGLSALVTARPDLHFHLDPRHLEGDPRGKKHKH